MVCKNKLPIILCVLFFSLLLPIRSAASNDGEDKEKLLESGNYTVVGAFTFFNNAVRFTEFTRNKGYDAEYGYAPVKKLYYVFILKTEDIKEAWRESYKLRKLPEFFDAWAMSYEYTPPPAAYDATQEKVAAGIEEQTSYGSERNETEADQPGEDEKNKSYVVYFNSTSVKTLKEVNTQVQVSGAKNRKSIATLGTHVFHTLTETQMGSQMVKLECTPFGYKRIDKFIDFDDPINDSTRSSVHFQGDTVIIDFELNRYKAGDYIIMYNVYFFQDAALMKPISKPELNELLEMLFENDKLHVKIHGHTNGNAYGKIIELSEEDKNYFKLLPTNKVGKNSAKQLSLSRAEIIKRYLIENGISGDRMEVKGWGGKRPIVDKFHGDADTNVRVEIEILKDS